MRFQSFLQTLLLAALLGTAALPAPTHAETPQSDLSAAKNEFNDGNFLSALSIVNRLTTAGTLTGDDLRDAFALQARCEGELGNRPNALAAFCEVIHIDPLWRPDQSLYTSNEKAIFEEALEECKPEGGGMNKWYLIGGGAAAVLIAIIAGGSGGDDPGGGGGGGGTLPDYPDPPGN